MGRVLSNSQIDIVPREIMIYSPLLSAKATNTGAITIPIN